MLTTQVDNNTSLSSAIVSKNPDVRRLQYLSEKPKMNLLSKTCISFLALLTIGLLTIPVSFSTVLANSNENDSQEIELLNMNFQMIPMAVTTKILSEFYGVNEVVVDPSLTSIIFTNFKVAKVNLADISDLTNIIFEIKNGVLVVSPRKGAVISKIMTDEEYNKKQNNGNELGAFLNLELEHVTMKNGVQHIWRKESAIWANFNSQFGMRFDNTREVNFTVTDLDDRVLINANIYSINDDSSKELIASPKVFTLYGSKATIQEGDEANSSSGIWTITIVPTKIKNPNLVL